MLFQKRFKKELIEKYKTLFDKQLKEIELRIPLMDAFTLIPHSHKYLKDLIMERTKEVQGMVVIGHEAREEGLGYITFAVYGKDTFWLSKLLKICLDSLEGLMLNPSSRKRNSWIVG